MERCRIALFPFEESGLVGSSSFTLTTSLVTPILSSSFLTHPKLNLTRTGSARVSVHERTFSKLPQVIQVQWKLQKQKDLKFFVWWSFQSNRLRSHWVFLRLIWARMPTAADEWIEGPSSDWAWWRLDGWGAGRPRRKEGEWGAGPLAKLPCFV